MKKTNCPNCGMPIIGEKCEYCGTVFIDFACIDTNKPFYIKVRHGDKILRAKCISNSNLTISSSSAFDGYYSGNTMMKKFAHYEACMDIHLDFLEDIVNGIPCLYEVIDTEEVSQDTLKEVLK